MNNAMIIDAKDNVAVVIEPVTRGMDVIYDTKEGNIVTIKAAEDIPIYHKIAIRDIKKGENIIKYGEHIGLAASDIKTGMHVHEHNVQSVRENL